MTRTPSPAELDAIERAGNALAALGPCSHSVALCSLGIAVSALLNALEPDEREDVAEKWIAVLARALGWEAEIEHRSMH